MLAKDGDCLMIYLAYHSIFDVYKRMCLKEKWAPYMKDVDQFVAPLQYSSNAKAEVEGYMKDAGFKNYRVELQEKSFTYNSMKVAKGELFFVHIIIKCL